MTEQDIYMQLREHLDNLPVGFPSTESKVELKILRELFTEEEAAMALHLSPFAATAADIMDNKIMGEKYLKISSKANTTPAIGALKAAANPALAPPAIKIFRSKRPAPIFFPSPSATQAPNWMEGPSLPRERPPPSAIAPPINLLHKVCIQLFLFLK